MLNFLYLYWYIYLYIDLYMHPQSCLTLCDPLDCGPPGSSVDGIFQARILEWVAISYSRWSSQPRYQTHVSCISCTGRLILYYCTTWEPYISIGLFKFFAPWQFSVSDPGGNGDTHSCCWMSPRPSGPQSLNRESSERERTWSKCTPFITTLTLKW